MIRNKCYLRPNETLYQALQNHKEQPPKTLRKKGAFKNFADFTGKHLCFFSL